MINQNIIAQYFMINTREETKDKDDKTYATYLENNSKVTFEGIILGFLQLPLTCKDRGVYRGKWTRTSILKTCDDGPILQLDNFCRMNPGSPKPTPRDRLQWCKKTSHDIVDVFKRKTPYNLHLHLKQSKRHNSSVNVGSITKPTVTTATYCILHSPSYLAMLSSTPSFFASDFTHL